MNLANPLLLTLNINNQAHEFFNTLRKKHFPAERNFLDAHLMLFHQLPPNEKDIINSIHQLTAQYKPMLLRVTDIKSIGNGVAYKVESTELSNFHRQLQHQWEQWLIPQDRQKLWPHITIQNKVAPDEAKDLLQQLSAEFKPFDITGTGLSLWEYKGGPWQFMESRDFTCQQN